MSLQRLAAMAVAMILGTGCTAIQEYRVENGNPFEGTERAIAVIQPTAGNTVKGTVVFSNFGAAMKIQVELEGLAPGKHGFHIHELGDTSAADGTSAGGHYNPEGHPHALPEGAAVVNQTLHAGDLGNIEADAKGLVWSYTRIIEAPWFSIAGPKNPILGRAVVIHANPDDGGQPVGNAGARVGYGVIGIAKN